MLRSRLTTLIVSTLTLAACGGPLDAQDAQDAVEAAEAPAIVQDELRNSPYRCTKQEEANRELLHAYHVTIWEQGRWDLIGDFVAPNFTSHAVPVLPNGQVPGYDFTNRFLSAFSNLTSHEDSIMSGGNRVSIQWTITATQTGDFFGIPATGRTIQFSGMDALRVENGKFVEHWGGLADQVDEVVSKLTAP